MGIVASLLNRVPYVRDLRAANDSYLARMQKVEQTARTSSMASGVALNHGLYEYEYNAKLRGSLRWQTLAEMSQDPHIRGALRHTVLPLLGAEWTIVPASDKAADVDVAEFCAANLLGQSSDRYGREYWIDTSWRQRLLEILDMLPSGFSMFHRSWRAVGAKRVFARIAWLEPSSVDPQGWKIDDQDNIVEVRRTYRLPSGLYRYAEPIPADQLSLYVWDLRGARYEGIPFTRPMYGAWFRKDMMQRYGAIWAQKVGAPAPYASYPQGWGVDEKTRFTEFVQELRGTAPTDAYFVGPAGADGAQAQVAFAGSDAGEIDRMRAAIDGENAEIAHAGGSKSQLLGETASGSRALAEPISDTELIGLDAVAASVCDYMGHGIANLTGEVMELCRWNYANVKEYPRVMCQKIKRSEGDIPSTIALITAGVLPLDIEVRRQIADRVGIKVSDQALEQLEREREEMRQAVMKNGGKPGEEDGDDEDGDTGGDDDKKSGDKSSTDDEDEKLEAFQARVEALLRPAEDGARRGSRFPGNGG